jgi:hypothetical protein
MKRKFYAALLTVLSIVSCKKDDDTTVISKGPYDKGYFIINEGQFNTKIGDIAFFSYSNDSLTQFNYLKVNTAGSLGTVQQTPEYGTVWNGILYIVTKAGGPLTAVDEYTLKQTAQNTGLPKSANAFIGLDNNKGLLSTDSGIYPITLPSLAVGNMVSGVSGVVTDMIRNGNYIFVLTADQGIVVLNAADLSVAKVLGDAIAGFANGKDGAVYAASQHALLKINTTTLAIETINVSFDVYYNEYTYQPGAIAASTKDNSVYLLGMDQKVYRYADGAITALITLPGDHYFYGKGIGYDAVKNTLVLTTTGYLYGDNKNTLYTYNTNGSLVNTLDYTGQYYPAMVVFH